MTAKTKSQTYKNIVKNNLENIFEQPNIILKNNKGNFKKRHGGLTVKFINNIDVNIQPSKVVINDELNNYDTDEIFIESKLTTKEVATQTDFIETKPVNNFIKSYYALTSLDDEKILNTIQEIFKLEEQLKIQKEEYDNLNSNWIKIVNNLSENEYSSLICLNDKLRIMERTKTNEWRSNSELRELYSLKSDIEKLKKRIIEQENLKDKIAKSKKKNIIAIKKTETKISQLKEKQDEYINKLSIPSLSLKNKINKRLDLQQELDEEENLNWEVRDKIFENINFLSSEIKQQWATEGSKKVTKIYEEILPIDNNYYYLMTFVHANQSISEKIIYFYNDKNNEITISQQIKQYENIDQYKNDSPLLEETLSNKNNVSFFKVTIKDFIKQQNDFKLEPTKTEKKIWCIFSVVTVISLLIPLLLLVPPIASILVIAIVIKVIPGIMGLSRIIASLYTPVIKKVESWWYNKRYGNTEKNEKEKNQRESIIKNLTSNNLETKLETQFNLLKQELNNRKNKNLDKLLINSKEINHKSNNILKNLNIKPLNVNNFDLSVRNTVNNQYQPSTSSNINHSYKL